MARKLSKHGKLSLTLIGLILVIITMGIVMITGNDTTTLPLPEPEYTVNIPTSTTVDSVYERNHFTYLDSIILRTKGEIVYGIQSNLFELQSGRIENGQTFSLLLNNLYNVDIAIINQLINKSKDVFDLRKMRVGNSYTAFLSTDHNGNRTLEYLVYDISKKDYVVFGTGHEVFVKVDQKEVKSTERYAEAVINNSLYGAIYENGLNPVLAVKLSEIYKWTIDFFGIQKGDSFRVIYEEEFIDGESIGIGKIYGAEFTHLGQSYLAVNFLQQGEDGYWDGRGVNLRKNFLSAPLSFSARISSRYGMRTHPIKRVRSMHNGVDYAAPTGTPVLAVADGRISRLGWDSGGGGKRIWITHDHGFESAYLHLHNYARGLGQGSRVKQGQVIGYVGSTGASTGPHLDFRIRKNGKYINPLKVPSTPTTPILNANKPAFGKMKDDILRVMVEYRP